MSTQAEHWPYWLEWSLGDRLRKIRRGAGVSQEEFAATLSVNKKSLAAWTNAPRNVVAIAKRIELAYGVPATWTLGLETKPGPGPDGPRPVKLPGLDSNQEPFDYRLRVLRAA